MSTLQAPAHAQFGGVVPTNRGGVPGLFFDGNVWRFKTPGGTNASLALGILRSPTPEPTSTLDDGTTWTYCQGPFDAYVCTDKVNILGNILIKGEVVYSLPPAQ